MSKTGFSKWRPYKPKMRWTEQRLRLFVALAQRGETPEAVAAVFDTSVLAVMTCRNKLAKQGTDLPRWQQPPGRPRKSPVLADQERALLADDVPMVVKKRGRPRKDGQPSRGASPSSIAPFRWTYERMRLLSDMLRLGESLEAAAMALGASLGEVSERRDRLAKVGAPIAPMAASPPSCLPLPRQTIVRAMLIGATSA